MNRHVLTQSLLDISGSSKSFFCIDNFCIIIGVQSGQPILAIPSCITEASHIEVCVSPELHKLNCYIGRWHFYYQLF